MRKLSIICSLISAVAALVLIAAVLPDTVPIHYNLHGEADWMGSKWVYALFALVPLIIAVSFEIYCRKSRNTKNRAVEEKIIPLLSFVSIALCWLMFPCDPAGMQRMDLRMMCGVPLILGMLMLVIFNYSGKIRQNRHFGIRLPWTLKNETVWKKTHRLSGFSGTAGGALMILSSIIAMFHPETAYLWVVSGTLTGIALTALVPAVYSCVLYHRLKKAE